MLHGEPPSTPASLPICTSGALHHSSGVGRPERTMFFGGSALRAAVGATALGAGALAVALGVATGADSTTGSALGAAPFDASPQAATNSTAHAATPHPPRSNIGAASLHAREVVKVLGASAWLRCARGAAAVRLARGDETHAPPYPARRSACAAAAARGARTFESRASGLRTSNDSRNFARPRGSARRRGRPSREARGMHVAQA